MASILQRLIRKHPLTPTLITNLNTRILSSPTHLSDPKPDPPVTSTPIFKTIPDESNPNPHSSTYYPSFSFDSFLNPISEIGHIQSAVSEEDVGIWADSVKKKRKKKMNKHKLKKLRKRLRRKT